MSVVDGLGAGLIAGGALTLLPSLLAPSPQLPGTFRGQDVMKDRRRDRTARASARVSSVATVGGAALLLVSSHEWVSLAAGAAVIVAAWVSLAAHIAQQYRDLIPGVLAIQGKPKGVISDTAAAVGLGPPAVPGYPGLPSAVDPALVLERLRERASFRRALLHPFGYRDGL